MPVGAAEKLNRQLHSEQPKPRKRCCSIHTSFRLMFELCRCAPGLSDRIVTRMPSRDGTFSFRSGSIVASQTRSARNCMFDQWVILETHVHELCCGTS